MSAEIDTPIGQKPMGGSVAVVIASNQSAIPVSGTITTGGLTDTQLRATPVPVNGTVAASNMIPAVETGLAKDGTDITTPTTMPAGGVGLRGWISAIWTKLNGTIAVTGTFFQATQPVSAASLPLPAGAATSANQQTNALTDAQLRATPVPVSGTVTTGGLTDTQLRASAVPVSLASVPSHAVTNAGTFAVQVTAVPSTPVTGTFFQATQPVSFASLPVDTYSIKEVDCTGTGANVVVAAGAQAVRLHYIMLQNDSVNVSDVIVTVKFGATTIMKLSLKPSQTYARNIGAGRRYVQGAAASDLTVTMSAAVGTVFCGVEHELI